MPCLSAAELYKSETMFSTGTIPGTGSLILEYNLIFHVIASHGRNYDPPREYEHLIFYFIIFCLADPFHVHRFDIGSTAAVVAAPFDLADVSEVERRVPAPAQDAGVAVAVGIATAVPAVVAVDLTIGAGVTTRSAAIVAAIVPSADDTTTVGRRSTDAIRVEIGRPGRRNPLTGSVLAVSVGVEAQVATEAEVPLGAASRRRRLRVQSKAARLLATRSQRRDGPPRRQLAVQRESWQVGPNDLMIRCDDGCFFLSLDTGALMDRWLMLFESDRVASCLFSATRLLLF